MALSLFAPPPIARAGAPCGPPLPIRSELSLFEQLAELQRCGHVKSAEDAVALLPEKMRGNFLLLPYSRSAQASSVESPRAILFNEDASQIIGVGSDQNHGDGRTIEFIERDAASGRYRFKPLLFEGAKAPNCNGCHHGRPIWDTNQQWADALPHFWLPHEKDVENLKTFREKAAGKGIFKYLTVPEKGVVKHAGDDAGMHDLLARNDTFTQLLARNDGLRLANEVAKLPNEAKFRPALVAAFGNADVSTLQRLIPETPAWMLKRKYERLLKDTQREIERYANDRNQRARDRGFHEDTQYADPSADQKKSDLNNLLEARAPEVAKLRLVFEEMGVPNLMDHWSMILSPLADAPSKVPRRGFVFSVGMQSIGKNHALASAGYEYTRMHYPELAEKVFYHSDIEVHQGSAYGRNKIAAPTAGALAGVASIDKILQDQPHILDVPGMAATCPPGSGKGLGGFFSSLVKF
jgi:hypothetical protein